jgi:hypothetical protein
MVGDADRMPSDVRREVDRLSDGEWRALTLQLGRYALQKSRRFYWRTGNAGELPYGEMTESIVSKALLLWMSGRRRWNRSEYSDLETFLKAAIDSLLSHSAHGFDNRRIGAGDDPVRVNRATPESDLLERERVTEHDRLLAEIVRQSSEDGIALEIVEAIRQGAGTRRAIAAATGRPAEVIDNGLKRIRRLGTTIARSRSAAGKQTI